MWYNNHLTDFSTFRSALIQSSFHTVTRNTFVHANLPMLGSLLKYSVTIHYEINLYDIKSHLNLPLKPLKFCRHIHLFTFPSSTPSSFIALHIQFPLPGISISFLYIWRTSKHYWISSLYTSSSVYLLQVPQRMSPLSLIL